MAESSPAVTPAGDSGPEGWAFNILAAARRTEIRVLRKKGWAHDPADAPLGETPSAYAELHIYFMPSQLGPAADGVVPADQPEG
jgi:hypothetical protein